MSKKDKSEDLGTVTEIVAPADEHGESVAIVALPPQDSSPATDLRSDLISALRSANANNAIRPALL